MTRYFMTIQEACWLILDAAAIGGAGDLFVLDMGEPVRIMDMARDLIRLSGRDPAEVPIRITGLRAGEKLNESLFYESETIIPTGVSKIMRVIDSAPPTDAATRARRLVSLARGTHDPALRAALFRAIDPRRLQAVPAPEIAHEDATAVVGAVGAGLTAPQSGRRRSDAAVGIQTSRLHCRDASQAVPNRSPSPRPVP